MVNHSVVDRCLEELSARIRVPRDVLATADILRSLARDSCSIKAYLGALLGELASAPMTVHPYISLNRMPLGGSVNSGSKCFELALHIHDGVAESLLTHSNYALCIPLSGSLAVEHYRVPYGWNPEIFDDTVRLEPVGIVSVDDEHPLNIRPGNDVFRFRPTFPTPVLKVISPPVSRFEWSFDVESLFAYQSVSGLLEETFAVHSCLAATALGDDVLAASLGPLTKHPSHFVRWAAAQALGNIDPGACMDALGHLRSDPHPHVARASDRALALLCNRF